MFLQHKNTFLQCGAMFIHTNFISFHKFYFCIKMLYMYINKFTFFTFLLLAKIYIIILLHFHHIYNIGEGPQQVLTSENVNPKNTVLYISY